MASRAKVLLSIALVATLGPTSSSILAQRKANPAGDIALPPLVWTCPMVGVAMPDGTMHADVIEDKAGNCAICKMALVAVRLDLIWTCPVHSIIAEKTAGKCPIDHRDLIQTTVQVSWTCAARPDINAVTPGQCPDGSAMVVKYTPRPHGNHNPQHGGQFFMAPDSWHHLEGAFPQAGTVRIYLYDDFTKPLPLDQVKRVAGRIVTKEAFDTAASVTKEIAAFPLALTRNGQYLEAKIDSRTVPAPMTAKVKFKADGPEYRFDFTFPEFTKDPLPPASPAQLSGSKAPVVVVPAPARKTAAPAAASSAPAPTPATQAAPATTVDSGPPVTAATEASAQPQSQSDAVFAAGLAGLTNPSSYERSTPIPATVAGIVAELSTHNQEIRGLIDRGSFTDMWVPAFQAKDLALAMNDHVAELPTYKRKILEPAITRLIRSAWLLDAFGDLGNREHINGAYADFVAAVSEIESLFEVGR
jgi:heavy metal-binding protein